LWAGKKIEDSDIGPVGRRVIGEDCVFVGPAGSIPGTARTIFEHRIADEVAAFSFDDGISTNPPMSELVLAVLASSSLRITRLTDVECSLATFTAMVEALFIA
jgi:hypothetical protein